MSNTRDIKARISSVQDTKKITNAMYLIASTKLQKARRDLDSTKPFFNAVRDEIKRIFQTAGNLESKYFYPKSVKEVGNDGTYGILVITSDKGLAGSYNMNVIKKTMKLLSQHSDSKLYVVGEFGRRYFARHNIPIEHEFRHTMQAPKFDHARDICQYMLHRFDSGELDKIFVIYTDMLNSVYNEADSVRLLPFNRTHFLDTPETEDDFATLEESDFEFFPSIEDVLNNMLKSYIAGFIYGALVNSFCSEQSSRMSAMDSSNRNADKLLGELSLRYNQVRQASITQEITEISSSAKAQKRKLLKGGASS